MKKLLLMIACLGLAVGLPACCCRKEKPSCESGRCDKREKRTKRVKRTKEVTRSEKRGNGTMQTETRSMKY